MSIGTTDLLYKQKPHYELLDGLRGVAALLVIWYHFFEGFATSGVDQKFNHGYLAVDFFFVLSGFVIGYAYDDRWKKGMTRSNFILRRIIRLQPMVVMAVVLGVIAFIIQGCEHWDHTKVPVWAIVVSFVMGLFMIPALPGTEPDVRGNGEAFPLVGPAWSLFFEYIGSILYAVWLHSLTTKALRVVVICCAVGLSFVALTDMSGAYSLGVGWSMGEWGFFGGLMRLGFSFGIGLLMSRGFKPVKIRGAFWICALMMAILMCMPYVTPTGEASVWNAVYDLICTLFLFPCIVYLGASGKTTDRKSEKICGFLGVISYPIYIIHYPAMYLFYSWVWNNGYSYSQVWPVTMVIFVVLIPLAFFFVKCYDEPIRRRLTAKLKSREATKNS
ncbi:MAG: acyltransferase [Paramuribaculum sp.]|nr:acyltransferase [Paramuribaculum sp.]